MSETTENTTPTEQTAAPVSPQWAGFIEAVNKCAQQYGVQAVVLSAAVPTQGSFGPTQVNSHGWLMGPAPEEWRNSVAPMFAQACSMAAAALMSPKSPESEATESADQPAAEEVSA